MLENRMGMRLSKSIHSCLLLEQDGEKLLFDPGKFSFLKGSISPAIFRDVSAVVITHDHPDHLYVEALRESISRSKASVIANGEVASRLGWQRIKSAIIEEDKIQAGPFALQAIPSGH